MPKSLDTAIRLDYVRPFQAIIGKRFVMRDAIRYEIFKGDSPGSPRWLEAIEGLEQAMNRLDDLAASDPSSDFYLYCNQADKLIRHVHRTSPSPDERPGNISQKKVG